MSALLDSLTPGGYDGSADGGIGDSSGSYFTYGGNSSGGGDYFSGLLQNLTALGTGVISRYADIELAKKAIGTMPYPGLGTTQNPIGGYGQVGRNPVTGQQYATLNLSAMMPILLVGLAVFFIAKKT